MTSDTQSVLDAMTAGIGGRKRAAAFDAGLAPAEPPAIYPTGDIFPYDGGLPETVRIMHDEVRRNMAKIEECMRSIERNLGMPEGGPPPFVMIAKDEQKRQEVAASEAASEAAYQEHKALAAAEVTNEKPGDDFASDFAAKSRAAQAQAFGSARGTWECADHGASALQQMTSKRGRTYLMCTTCHDFEKVNT